MNPYYNDDGHDLYKPEKGIPVLNSRGKVVGTVTSLEIDGVSQPLTGHMQIGGSPSGPQESTSIPNDGTMGDF